MTGAAPEAIRRPEGGLIGEAHAAIARAQHELDQLRALLDRIAGGER